MRDHGEVLLCPACDARNPGDARYCSWCGTDIGGVAPTPVDRPSEVRGGALAVLAVAVVVNLTAVSVLFVQSVDAPDVAPTRQAADISAPPAEPSGAAWVRRPFARSTLRSMAASGARSLAMNMASGNQEMVDAIMGGPFSLAAASHCSMRMIATVLVDSPEHERAARMEHRAGLVELEEEVQPRATGSATARVPRDAPPPTAVVEDIKLEGNAVRVSVVLYNCDDA